MHSLARPSLDRDGRFSLSRANGRLIARTLLPANATTQVVDGFAVDGTTVNPLVAVEDTRGMRVEVTAPRGNARGFSTSIDVTRWHYYATPPASLVEDADSAGVRIADPAGSGRTR